MINWWKKTFNNLTQCRAKDSTKDSWSLMLFKTANRLWRDRKQNWTKTKVKQASKQKKKKKWKEKNGRTFLKISVAETETVKKRKKKLGNMEGKARQKKKII